MKFINSILVTTAATLLLIPGVQAAGEHPMGFFVTSHGIGNGADLGGLAGADAHCAKLAQKAGSTGQTWRAYISTQSEDGKTRGKSARDRIGSGPWYNARGELIASDLDELHLNPNIIKRTALDENGNSIKGRGDKPNEHSKSRSKCKARLEAAFRSVRKIVFAQNMPLIAGDQIY